MSILERQNANVTRLSAASRNGKKIGLLAGWGRYPLIIAKALKEQGYQVYGLGVKGHADPVLSEYCHNFSWVGLARIGAAIRYFKKNGVHDAMMAGKVHKVLLYQPWVWFKHTPDWRAIRCFYQHFLFAKKDRKDDTLLTAIVNEFVKDDVHFHPATDFVPELLVKTGTLTNSVPSAAEFCDIEFGWNIAKEMGRLDVGQSVVVKGRTAIAIEAIEGTDECIRRAGKLCKAGRFTVVKVAKPQQDMRFDVPTVGLKTLETMLEAGGKILAIEAGKTIILDEPAVIDFADKHHLAIVALDAAGGTAQIPLGSPTPSLPENHLKKTA